jgi:hypothetical protein
VGLLLDADSKNVAVRKANSGAPAALAKFARHFLSTFWYRDQQQALIA